MEKTALTSKVLDFRRTGRGRADIEREVALLSYRFVRRSNSLNEDEAGDFYCEYYPKLMQLIDTFTYQGKPFEAYLYISLRWHIIHFRKVLYKQKLSQTIFAMDSFWETPRYEADELKDVQKELENPVVSSNRTVQKRLIYLALRESEYLDHAMIEEIVSAAQIDRRWFLNCVMALKSKLDHRRARLTAARQYHNRCFFHFHMLQLRLRQCTDDRNREALELKLEKMKVRLRRSADRIHHIHVHPTNQEISEVLKIPKGTIDSGIYYLRNSFRDPQKNEAA